MPVLMLGLGCIMTIIGLYAVYSGWGVVVLERGWTMIIAGSVVATGGVIVAALGLLLGDLRRLLAERPLDAVHPLSITPDAAVKPATSAADIPAPALVSAGAAAVPLAETTSRNVELAAPISAEAMRPVAPEEPEPLLTSLFRNEPAQSPVADMPTLDAAIISAEPEVQLSSPTPQLPPLDALRSVLDIPMPLGEEAEKPRPTKSSDRFSELLRPLRDLAEPSAPIVETLPPLKTSAEDASLLRTVTSRSADDVARTITVPEPNIDILPPVMEDPKSSDTPKSGRGGGLADRWLNRARAGKRSDKADDAAIPAAAAPSQAIDVSEQGVPDLSNADPSEHGAIELPPSQSDDINLQQTDWRADNEMNDAGHPEAASTDAEPLGSSAPVQPDVAYEPAMIAPAQTEAVQPAMDIPTVVRTYTAGGHTYMMFSDGSIEADTPEGVFKFGSIDELKAFIASRSGENEGA